MRSLLQNRMPVNVAVGSMPLIKSAMRWSTP
jgi:hypothetical protein